MTREDTLAANIEGSHGTIVFGGGVAALTGHVQDVGDDYITLEGSAGTQPRKQETHLIPLASIVYFRFS